MTRRHTKEYGATEGCPRCKGTEQGRSMPHNNECRLRIKARMEQSEEGRDGLKKEEQRQDRHHERGDMRSIEREKKKSSAKRRSISENLWRSRTMMVRERERGRKRSEKEEPRRSARSKHGQPERRRERHEKKTENEGEHEEAKGQDSMVVRCLCEAELTRRDIHEAVTTRGRYDVNRAMDVPIEEDYKQKLAEAWDYIDGQELEPEVVKKARVLEMEWYWKMNVHAK